MIPKRDRTRIIALLACLAGPCCFDSFSLRAQAPDEVEKAIANLPPPQRAYERFRAWVNSLPPDQRRGPEVAERYRAYLKGRGFSDSEAADQLRLVEEQGARSEIERWKRIL